MAMVAITDKSKVERIRPLQQETDNSPCAVESNAFDGNEEPKHEINAKKRKSTTPKQTTNAKNGKVSFMLVLLMCLFL